MACLSLLLRISQDCNQGIDPGCGQLLRLTVFSQAHVAIGHIQFLAPKGLDSDSLLLQGQQQNL